MYSNNCKGVLHRMPSIRGHVGTCCMRSMWRAKKGEEWVSLKQASRSVWLFVKNNALFTFTSGTPATASRSDVTLQCLISQPS